MQNNVKIMATYDDMFNCIEDAVEIAVNSFSDAFVEGLFKTFGSLEFAVPVFNVMEHLYNTREYKLLAEMISSFYVELLDFEPDFSAIFAYHEIAHEPFTRFFIENFEYAIGDYLE